jgi:adenylate cyclase
MGFPQGAEDDIAYTEADAEALGRAGALVEAGLVDRAELLQEVRLLSLAVSTIADSHAERFAGRGGGDGNVARGDGAVTLEVLDEIMRYLYRRQLLAAIRRVVAMDTALVGATPERVVGFADLTGFSGAARTTSDGELVALVEQFFGRAADVIASVGGRVVKLVGDEVMFAVDDPEQGVIAGIELAALGESLPVHVGLALGEMISHHGDLFGPAVNVASRLTDLARPGTVLVNEDLARRVGRDEGYDVRPIRLRRPLKGVGAVRVFRLRRRDVGSR